MYSLLETDYGISIKNNFVNNYYRYLDDIFVIYDSQLFDVDSISNLLNELDPDLHFDLETKGSSVYFLDVNIYLDGSMLKTDIYYKPTDSKQYLDFRSHHPRHIKRALPYNLSRRVCTIVSDYDLRLKRLNEMKFFLKKCHYPENLINDGINKAMNIDRNILIHPNNEMKNHKIASNNLITHVSTYNSNYSDNGPLLRSFFNKLKENNTTCEIFENQDQIFSKRQPPNLKSILTNARLGSKETGVVSRCNKPRCQLCNIIISGNSFTFYPTNFNFIIKSNMSCNTLNCIYVIKCLGCQKLYIGETKNLRFRTNLHRDHSSKNIGLNVSRHIYECTRGKCQKDKFFIMPFYKVSSDNSAMRKSMETFFRKKFKPELNRDS